MNDLISIVMPVYNAEKYLSNAISSVLCQTYKNFEFLIFNDGSKDNSISIIKSFNDERIKLFDYLENRGYVAHLNKGIEISNGKYILRMDADDICEPSRFTRQVHFMNNNPQVIACGTWFDIINNPNQIIMHPIDNANIRLKLIKETALGHPTVILRAGILKSLGIKYDKTYVPTEDYKLWFELSKYGELANIPEVLLHYRLHDNQISVSQRLLQEHNANRVVIDQIKRFKTDLSEVEIDLHLKLIGKKKAETISDFENIKSWVELLINQTDRDYYDYNLFKKFILKLYKDLIFTSLPYFKPAFLKLINFHSSELKLNMTNKEHIRFKLKCMIWWRVWNLKKNSAL